MLNLSNNSNNNNNNNNDNNNNNNIYFIITFFLVCFTEWYNFENLKLQAKQNMLDVKKQRLNVACQEVG